MSVAIARRSQVVLNGDAGGRMSAADRATLTRLLLERGLEVSYRREAAVPAVPDASAPSTVVVGSPGGAIPADPVSGVQVIEAEGADPAALAAAIAGGLDASADGGKAAWKPWFPVIDYSRCTNCMQCLSFCLFDVYGVSAESKIQVQHQNNCKTECPACSRVCPEVAIMFPKYRHGPINGEEVKADDIRREAMKVDISALLGGDVYSMLRDRSVKAKSRFSKERDDDRALKERQTCLIALQKELDVPAEVLAALPSPAEILAKAEAARARAQGAESKVHSSQFTVHSPEG
jgi:NAD-dependent dihydropyrimidine dehydrogenase PreA subunit